MESFEPQNYLRKSVIFGLPILMIIFSVLILKSRSYLARPDLMSFAVTFDFLFTIPIIYYFLIRSTKITKNSISILLTLNIILATIFISNQNQFYLNFFKKWFLPLLEVIIIGILVFKVRKGIRDLSEPENRHLDFFNILKKVAESIVPKSLVTPLSTEIAVFYYGFLNWKKPILKENEFSYHKKSAIIAILSSIIFLTITETFVVHKLLVKWNDAFAWVITAISIYTIIQIFGILRAIPKRPIAVLKNGISIKYSFISETFVEFENIRNVEMYNSEILKKGNIKYFSPFGKFEGNNIKIELMNEQTVESFYGIKRKLNTFVLNVDDENEFIKQVKLSLPKT
ncbi:hypothetical protein [Halpernia frigidisoli]|uniref:Uncharacterized protein n=1 Tax=Halpernia frigidisoli TaxID=1125876 RepID=A0A1I3G156_9FLAO|nr:hypothetical protein [Halpernia frigidisoli]SFI17179.1 hypothetical protein SAMN05443292_1767 [Halpernia frigidisoli]